MKIACHDLYWPEDFASEYPIEKADSLAAILSDCDIISLHTNLTDATRNMICANSIATMKPGVVIVNCARGELVNSQDMLAALQSGAVGGYATDVLDEEPPSANHPLLNAPNCLITPHIGSRTYESVERQAMMATENLRLCLKGEKPLAQVNEVAIPAALI